MAVLRVHSPRRSYSKRPTHNQPMPLHRDHLYLSLSTAPCGLKMEIVRIFVRTIRAITNLVSFLASSDYSPSGSSLNTPFDLPFPFDYPWSGAVPGSSDDFPEAAHTAMYNGEPLNLLEKQSRLRSPFQYSPSGSSRSSPSPSTADSQFQDITPSDGQDIFVSADDRGTFKPRRYRCPKPNCNRRFMNQYTLEVHTKSHNTKLRASYPCEMGCNEHFSRRHDRLRHEVTQHGRVCEWVCDDCGRFFSSAKTMGHHKCPVARQKTIWINSDAMVRSASSKAMFIETDCTS